MPDGGKHGSHCHRQTARAPRGIGWMFISRSCLLSTISVTHTAIVTDPQEQPSETIQPHCYSRFTGHIQAHFEYLQKSRLHRLSGQPVLLLCHPQTGFSSYSVELPVFSLCPLLFVLVLGITEKRVWPNLLTTTPEVLVCIGKSSFLQAKQAQVSQPFLTRDAPVSSLPSLPSTGPFQ